MTELAGERAPGGAGEGPAEAARAGRPDAAVGAPAGGAPGGRVGAVLVVGGGVAGIQAALDLAEGGFRVYVVEKTPSIGGVMAQLDKTFPTNDCAMCILAPKLVETGRHKNIEIINNAEVEAVDGGPGRFTVSVRRRLPYINPGKCTACGRCAEVCPIETPSAFEEGVCDRKAVFVPFPQAVPLCYTIDRRACVGCGRCAAVCPAKAVEFSPEETETRTLEVGSIILAPGFEKFDPTRLREFGYRVFPNVITSIELERMLSASGPTRGHIFRPSDGKIPEKLAFIQCVGSRFGELRQRYCSAVCCMLSVKEALIAQEHVRGLRSTIFFMDMRAFGKDFDEYYRRAEREYGVRFVMWRPSHITQKPGSLNLELTYETAEGKLVREEFDMVVLAAGIRPPADARGLARAMGIKLNPYGFCQTGTFTPTETSRPGIYVAGAFAVPQDVPDSVANASGAAARAASVVASERGALVQPLALPPETDVSGEEPRVGVFVCRCGINIAGTVDVTRVVEAIKKEKGVVYAAENTYTCSQDTLKNIQARIREHSLNRIVVASCTPRTHAPLFQATMREAGLNPYLFEMANLREQCSWVHMLEREEATEKAIALVRMAVARARTLQPLQRLRTPVKKSALVIGGGISGMTAALEMAAQGYPVTLVEREPELGGISRRIHYTLDGLDVRGHLEGLIKRVEGNPLVRVMKGTEVRSVEGFVGNFRAVVGPSGRGAGRGGERAARESGAGAMGTGTGEAGGARHVAGGVVGGGSATEKGCAEGEATGGENGREEVVEAGVIIVATGGREYRPEEHLFGKNERVITQLDLEERIASGALPSLKTVVMIQCVGSRNERRTYCSRVCCTETIKNALRLKRERPGVQIFILYRDMRTYGFREEWFREARELGINFIRHEDAEPPLVEDEGGGLRVTVRDPVIGRRVVIRPDLVVLAVATLPAEGAEELARMLKVPLNKNGFFLEAHVKLRPLDFATDGIFLCGLAHSPKFVEECIFQAQGAVARACGILSKDELEAEAAVAVVDEARCRACGTCVKACDFRAPELVDAGEGRKVSRINAALCKGCGKCVALCCNRAISILHFGTEQIMAAVEAALCGPVEGEGGGAEPEEAAGRGACGGSDGGEGEGQSGGGGVK
ncbi:MAG: CoB--CoM heterodisulfide reductase iron-sulfur subunit A family protein [Thermoplasmata archaeon]